MAIYQPPSPGLKRYFEQHSFSDRVREGGLGYLLNRWTRIVAEVETGYRRVIYEYLDDMDTRGIIDELATYASDEEWAEVEALLPSLDDRFHQATRPVESCIWGEQNAAEYGYRADHDWWYFRVPLNLECVRDRDEWPYSHFGVVSIRPVDGKPKKDTDI